MAIEPYLDKLRQRALKRMTAAVAKGRAAELDELEVVDPAASAAPPVPPQSEAAPPSGGSEASPAGVPDSEAARRPTEEDLLKQGYTTVLPYEDGEADCFVIACSDHRFRPALEEFVEHGLGFHAAHMVLIPSGVALADPLITTAKFLTQAVDKVIERVIHAKGVKDVICVAHEGCGAYSVGKVQLINLALQRFARKSPEEVQLDHLRGSARRIRSTVSGVRVRAFLAAVDRSGSEARVNFKEVPL